LKPGQNRSWYDDNWDWALISLFALVLLAGVVVWTTYPDHAQTAAIPDDLCQRVCENSIRIANNIAIGRGARAVWRPDIEFGIQLMEQSFEAVTGGVERYMFERFEFPKMCEAVFNKIVTAGGKISSRDLYRAFRNHQAWGNEVDRACRYLELEGRIAWVANLGTSNNKSPGWIVVEET
jgi:hypothetical protein